MAILRGRIRRAKSEDIEYIQDWLQAQSNTGVSDSFLCNWNSTYESLKDGDGVVFVESASSQAVAYQWGSLTRPGILEVRDDMRGKGIGKRLVEYRIKQAYRKDMFILHIQCKPSSSIPFWKKMGFELYGKDNNAYRIIEKELEVPSNGAEVDVVIEFYPECKMWKQNALPLKYFWQKALKTEDNIIHLRRRVSIPGFHELWEYDVIVRIIVDGKEIYCDKAKYEEAGVEWCENGFSMDCIYLK